MAFDKVNLGKRPSENNNIINNNFDNAAKKENSVFFVDGSASTVAGTWLGTNPDITKYFDGLTISYKVGVAGASTTTLNINGLGAKTCYLRGTTKVTTHYAVGTMILLSYNATTGAFYSADYDANTNTQIRVYRQTTGYNSDYPIIVSRTATASIGTPGSNSTYAAVYGVIGGDGANTPTINPHTGAVKASSFIENGTALSEKYATPAQVDTKIDDAVKGLLGGTVDAAYDTFKEIQDLMKADDTATANLISQVNTNTTNILTLTSNKLDKTTYEWNKELACGSNGKVCIGKFGAYDTNITIELSSTTSVTYNATIVIQSQNIVANGTGGSCKVDVYGDASNSITPLLSIFRPSGSASRQIEVYANLPGWSKNIVHIQAVALSTGYGTDILTSVTEIPTAIEGKTKVIPTNLLTTKFLGINAKAASATVADSANSVAWANVSGKPSSYYSLPTASSSTLGGVKTTSTVTSTSGLTACPIINGVPYYKDTNTTYSLPLAASGTRGGIQVGYSATGANIPVQLSSEKAYVALTSSAITSAIGKAPLTVGGGTLNDGATLKFSTYGTRFVTISGNSITADMSNETGGWAGAFASVKDPSGATTTMLGWYGGATGLTHIYMGGSYSDPYLKFTPNGQFTFKNTPKVGSVSLALTTDITNLTSKYLGKNENAVSATVASTVSAGYINTNNIDYPIAFITKNNTPNTNSYNSGVWVNSNLTYNPSTGVVSAPALAEGGTSLNDKYQAKGNYLTSIPLAASGTRGGIQIGYTATSTSGSVYNAPVALSSEKAYVAITKSAITTALGYTPPTTNTTYSQATSSALGLVKIGYTENGKNYPVELNSSGQMFVNVPWTDTNTTTFAASAITSGTLAAARIPYASVGSSSSTSGTKGAVRLRLDGTTLYIHTS